MVTAGSPPKFLSRCSPTRRRRPARDTYGGRDYQELNLIFKHGDQIARRTIDPCQFVPLIGKYGWPENLSKSKIGFNFNV